MPIIKKLPENLINQIAAGEVVERPASAAKELAENSLDAGAKRITVEIIGSGRELIRITDDGTGMDREDALLAFERHATSKIASSEDLFNIRSLGFRGEAIASIASVAKVILRTKKKGALEGTYVLCEGGKVIETKPLGTPEGTQIELTDLFFNTPARSKYLKNPSTEYNHILDALTGLALVHHNTAFRLIHDGKPVFDLPPTDDFFTRIKGVLGKNIADELVPVYFGHSKMQIEGFIGKPEIARANRNNQYLFVNGRSVKSASLAFAVRQSFYSLLPKERHPVFILSLNIDPEMVDVNVHPRKAEVRFLNEKEVFRAVMLSCEKALSKYVLSPNIRGENNEYDLRRHRTIMKIADAPLSAAEVKQPVLFSNINADNPPEYGFKNDDLQDFRESAARPREETAEIIPVAQIGNSYILCQQESNLVIVDQHAAHERIRYTEICEQFESRKKPVQPLLMPAQLELSHKDVAVLKDNMELLETMGFEIENFGGNTFSVLAVPSYISKENLEKVIAGLIDDLNDQAAKGDFQKRKERALTYMACRSAVKFGDKLSPEEQRALLKKLQTLEKPYTCPHGRPTMITLSFNELEKRFGRLNN